MPKHGSNTICDAESVNLVLAHITFGKCAASIVPTSSFGQ